MKASHINFVHEKLHMDVEGGGGGGAGGVVAPVTFLRGKILENFDGLFKNF